MRVLFCDDRIYRDTIAYQQLWKLRKAPAQTLYGALQLPENGIELKIAKYNRTKPFKSRIGAAFYTTCRILVQSKNCNAIFSISYRGLELLMILRRLHLFKKPIFVWQHAAFQPEKNKIENIVKKWILKGIDEMFFFNYEIALAAIQTGKVDKYCVIPFGADLKFYTPFVGSNKKTHSLTFLSSGVENRDYNILIQSFADFPVNLEIYTFAFNGQHDYKQVLESCQASNVHIHILSEPLPPIKLREITD